MVSTWSLSPAWQGKSVRTLGLFAAALAAVFCSFILVARPAAADTCNFLSVGDSDFNTAGNWSCGAVPTGADDVIIGSGTTTNLSASVTVQSISVSGTLNAVSFTLQSTSTATVLSGGTVSSTSGIMQFASVTSTGSVGTVSGAITVTSTFQNNGTFAIGSGTATTTGVFTNAVSGTVNNNTGTLVFESDFTNNGTFNANTGTVRFHGGNDQSVPVVTFYNLIVQKSDGTVATMAGDVTASNAFTLVTGIYAVGTNTFTASGTYVNSGGQVTISSGDIVHALTSFAFTTSDGSATSTATITFTSGGGLYVTLADDNRNLSATNTETMTVAITATASTADSETLTLTETGDATGIFRNTSALPLSYAPNAVAEDGTFTINNGSYTGTVSYTDLYDATDTGSDTLTFTVAAASSGSGSSDTGGGGLGASPGIPPVTTEFQVQEVVVDGAVIPVHTLVKLVCPAGAGVNHACTAVYYVSSQGKRHAFPNDKVYFTWYNDFSGVQLMSDSQMAGIALGKNVTYKPGVKMVKFTTDPKVYAVEKGGLLRWVTSEAVATSLYGSLWNTMIDDINDAFYTNYRFGADITSTAGYNAATAEASVTYPSDSLES
jgi:hypothetical protein